MSNNQKYYNFTNNFDFVSATPNPVNDYITINFICPEQEKVEIFISDINGKIINEFSLEADKGLNITSYPAYFLTNGAYLISIKYKDEIKSQKFIKF